MSLFVHHHPINRPLAELNRFLENGWNEFDNGRYILPLDVQETDEAFVVMAELPGVNPDEVEIKLHEDVLTISGEIRRESAGENLRYLIHERHSGKFSRNLRFRAPINAESVNANFENGLLTITVPKAEEAQPRIIRVAANGNGGN